MYSLQTKVTANDRDFTITEQGDFRMVLDVFGALGDEKLGEDYRVLAALLIFYNELNSFEDIQIYQDYIKDLIVEMYRFINCGKDESPGRTVSTPLIDWDKDSQMICAAVNNVAKQEVRALEYLHWWTFMGYYTSVGESVFSTVISIRHKITAGKPLEKWEKEFKRDNPGYFIWKATSVEDRELEDMVRDLWSQGGE